jgi:YegS/Rv2252/BmrU family lipid kinase
VGEGRTLAKQAAQEGYTLVAAAGGDGTINEVATGLIGTDATLAIIPVGSGNGLARGLQIPLNTDDACKLILEGVSQKIDVGQVCGRYFYATSGIGFDAHVGKVYNESPKHSRGLIPYFQIAVSEYFNYTPEKVILRCNGKTFCYTPLILTVANTEQYGGGAIIAPGALPDDGLFDVSVILQAPIFSVVNQLPKLFSGEIDTFSHFRVHKAASLTVTRSCPGPVHVDGESFMAGETLTYSMQHHGLSVLVPQNFTCRNKNY